VGATLETRGDREISANAQKRYAIGGENDDDTDLVIFLREV